jgi:thioredoxin-like negative regulator of GroEL
MLVVVAVFAAVMLFAQVAVRRQARAMRGKPIPILDGPLAAVAERERALVYFFSPSCGACRPITPRLRELERKGGPVFLVNVAEDLSAARAFKVMATPSIVEVERGVVVGFHVGPPPAEVLARFA